MRIRTSLGTLDFYRTNLIISTNMSLKGARDYCKKREEGRRQRTREKKKKRVRVRVRLGPQ